MTLHWCRFNRPSGRKKPSAFILKYSEEGDLVLDPMVGGGTSAIEAKLLKRKFIGIDINPNSIDTVRKLLNFDGEYEPEIIVGDARAIEKIKDESIDLIITHPPYLNIIKYSDGIIDGDLSNYSSPNLFLKEFEKVILELKRVLKPNKYCAVLIGDTRKRRHFVPLAYMVMSLFLKHGFILKEDIIKTQHNCKSTPQWKNVKMDFYLIMHEHLFVFRKPNINENLSDYKWSMKI
ncbi:MAG: hypothetical protein UV53_C0036G0001 [Candidatus Azambacteria bacterium GW2011_GWE1_42_9]|nr:MAG: hypothetical protein UV53_C0036G0001 [Candidatus Azambacteria bacterium GW2011_GWE1_42_9]